jgi:ATP-dependent Clp protease ATP-binding subunit ClpB
MDFEQYTYHALKLLQSAQQFAVAQQNQELTPEHLLRILLGHPNVLAARLIDRAGGRSRDALKEIEVAVGKLPKVSGTSLNNLYLQHVPTAVNRDSQDTPEVRV